MWLLDVKNCLLTKIESNKNESYVDWNSNFFHLEAHPWLQTLILYFCINNFDKYKGILIETQWMYRIFGWVGCAKLSFKQDQLMIRKFYACQLNQDLANFRFILGIKKSSYFAVMQNHYATYTTWSKMFLAIVSSIKTTLLK